MDPPCPCAWALPLLVPCTGFWGMFPPNSEIGFGLGSEQCCCVLSWDDIDAIETWLLRNHLELNASKCKYMIISCKHCPCHLANIANLETSALKQSGLIYRRFYHYSSLKQLSLDNFWNMLYQYGTNIALLTLKP